VEFRGDFHMHSTYSDGRADITEMVEAARVKGLEAIAITDHGPNNVGSGVRRSQIFLKIKEELDILNDEYSDIKLFSGCEADIVGLNGEIDVPPVIYHELDLLIVGLHPLARPDDLRDLWALNGRNQAARVSKGARQKVINTNTKTLIAAMEKNPVDIISHPGLGMPINVGEVARACVKHEVFYEINCGHSFPALEDVLEAHAQGVDFIVDSDAHFTRSVGRLEYGSNLLERALVPEERVVNVCSEGKQLPWEK